MGGESAGSAAQARLRLAGKPQCLDLRTGLWVDLPAKGAAVLLMLVIEGAVSRARLFGLLWPDGEDDKPRVNLRGLLRDLRALAGCELVKRADTLELAFGVEHDLAALTDDIAGLDDAPQGQLLGACDYTKLDAFLGWLAAARERWQAARQRALHRLAQRLQATGRPAQALDVAQRLLYEEPADEAAVRLQMQLLYSQGDTAAALAAYARCRSVLRREMGADPSQRTRALVVLIETGQSLAAAPVPATRFAALAPQRLVGREVELRAVEAAWSAGQRVWLEGEPGIGKSRLLSELVSGRPSRVLCSARLGDAEVPFATLTRLLHTLLARGRPPCSAAATAEMARLLPELGAASTQPARTALLVRALSSALAAWQAEGLSALLLDDVQWADAASMALCMPALEAVPALAVLLAARQGSQEAGQQVDLGVARTSWTVIKPRPLDAPAVDMLLGAMGLRMRHQPAWGVVLAERALGVPLHIIETVLALRNGFGDLVFQGPPPTAAALPVPAPLQDLVQARLSRLSAPERQLAQLAALSGSLFSVRLATAVMRQNELELAGLWAGLEADGVLREGAVAHDTLQDALLAGLPAPVARELHARVAEHGQAHGAAPAELARHWQRAHAWAQAALAFEHAAAGAFAVNARAEEARLWDEAAACRDQLGQAAASHAARRQACLAALTVAPPDQVQARVDALLAASIGGCQRLDTLLVQAQVAFISHDLERLLAAGEEATGLAQEQLAATLATPGAQARLLEAVCGWSLGLTFHGQAERALQELNRHAELAAACEDQRRRLAYEDACACAQSMAGQNDASILSYGRALTLARHVDDAVETQKQLGNLAISVARAGDYARSLLLVRESVEIGEKLGEAHGIVAAAARMMVGGFSARLGHFQEALEEMQQAMQLFRAMDARPWLADCEGHLAMVHLDMGQPALATQTMRTPPAPGADHRLVRRVFELRLLRAAGQSVLTELLALRSGCEGARFDNRLAVELLLSREQEGAQAVQTCEQVVTASMRAGARALARYASLMLVDALRRDGRVHEAAAAAQAALAGIETCRPFTLYYAEAFWLAALALQSAGEHAAMRQALQQGRTWIVEEALPHVRTALRQGFLEHNPVNRSLLAAAEAGTAA